MFSMTAILFFACEAPRENPLDPQNPDNAISFLEGEVLTLTIPNAPIERAEVFWRNSNTLLNTNEQGRFSLELLTRPDGWIFFEKEGYSPDSQYIFFGGTRDLFVQAYLNSIPTIDTLMIFSEVENRYPARQSYSLVIRTRIGDEENDVDSVFALNPITNGRSQLTFNPSTQYYERAFTTAELGVVSIDEVIGKEFEIVVRDNSGKGFTIGSSNVKRIIKAEIEFDSPSNNQTVQFPLQLEWKRFLPGFDFSFTIQIYTNEVSPALISEINNVPQDAISYTFSTPLPVGEYFWVIWCTDEFMNRSRSKPATFTVE